jgi:glycosyltransferase involved in cell wall biosynthesis
VPDTNAARRPKVAFVYSGSRARLASDVAAGTAADSFLLGQNHLDELGYDADVHEPRIGRLSERSGLVSRVRWSAREIVLPWELGDADLLVTSLFNVVPSTARIRRRPRTVMLDFELATVLDRRRGLRRRVLRHSIDSAAAIVSLSDSQRGRLLERTRLDPSKVHTVLLGIDHEFLRPENATGEGGGHVLAVGRDLARDYPTLARAAGMVDAPFVFVAFEHNVRGLDLPPNVEVRHGLTYAELRDLYAGAACCVLPLRPLGYPYGTESGGLTALMEAMAMARPLVVSDRPIVHEYVQAGESAVVVPPEQPETLARAIERVLGDDDLARRLGSAARRRIEQRHTMRQFAQGLVGVFERLGFPGARPA